MDWTNAARDAARETIRLHGVELWDEAERIGARNEAGAVSPSYVHEAALYLRLQHASTALADAALAVGSTLAGIAGGIAVTAETDTTHRPEWLLPLAVGLGILGVALLVAGVTVKVLRR